MNRTGTDRTITTDYSRALVMDEPHRRSLYFLHEDGVPVLESAMDYDDPVRLIVPYTRVMLAAHLFVPFARRVAIMGTGGGSMYKYYDRFFPRVHMDGVEIDRGVINLAQEFFHLHVNEKKPIHIQDARLFLEETNDRYDIIHMDTYLVRQDGTDSRGYPLTMKNNDFFALLKRRLTDRGVIAFNLNSSDHIRQDVQAVLHNFRGVYRFTVPRRGNVVLVATNRDDLPSRKRLALVGRWLDLVRPGRDPSFRELASLLRQYWVEGIRKEKEEDIDLQSFL